MGGRYIVLRIHQKDNGASILIFVDNKALRNVIKLVEEVEIFEEMQQPHVEAFQRTSISRLIFDHLEF